MSAQQVDPPILVISLLADTATALLRRDADGRWRWFDITNGADDDTEMSGATAVEALDVLVASRPVHEIDGDLSDHYQAARALDAA